MPPEELYPGVFVQEVPTGVKPIAGVTTSVTAFIGRTLAGAVETPTQVRSLTEYVSFFGAMAAQCPLCCAVGQFFANGGAEAVIVRLDNGGQSLSAGNFNDPALESQQRGLWALQRAPQVNLIVIPPLAPGVDVPVAVWNTAIALATEWRAFVLVDPPMAWSSAQDAIAGVDDFVARSANAALYFPRVLVNDPVNPGQTMVCAPAGMIAGIFARMDAQRGVWKPPAGAEADLRGVVALSVSMASNALEALNQKAVNALREVPGGHRVIWGARTLVGTDGSGSDWKYVNVRRLLIFIERSLYEGIQWAVFEPNGEGLWQKIRDQVTTFLMGLWRSGAMQGATAKDAFFVHCDRETMSQDDIDNGRLRMLIGIAALKPAEFVILKIIQRTGAGQ
jgi:phage tail sheath protein FI